MMQLDVLECAVVLMWKMLLLMRWTQVASLGKRTGICPRGLLTLAGDEPWLTYPGKILEAQLCTFN